MKSITRIVFILLAILTMLFSSIQISSNNEVFENAMFRCCDLGMCHGQPCSDLCSITFYPECKEYVNFSCEQCMEFLELNRVANYRGPSSTYCVYPDGSRYEVQTPLMMYDCAVKK